MGVKKLLKKGGKLAGKLALQKAGFPVGRKQQVEFSKKGLQQLADAIEAGVTKAMQKFT